MGPRTPSFPAGTCVGSRRSRCISDTTPEPRSTPRLPPWRGKVKLVTDYPPAWETELASYGLCVGLLLLLHQVTTNGGLKQNTRIILRLLRAEGRNGPIMLKVGLVPSRGPGQNLLHCLLQLLEAPAFLPAGPRQQRHRSDLCFPLSHF